MTTTDTLQWRYATKKFAANALIAPEDWNQLEASFRWAPSSLGLQLWKFIVIDDPALRERLCEASFGQSQVRDASHYVVLCARSGVDEQDIADYVALMQAERGMTDEEASAKCTAYQNYSFFWKDEPTAKAYLESQIHLACGFVSHAAATMRIDSCIIGGMNPAAYDDILGLTGGRYRAVLGMAFGYRSPEDAHAKDKKIRYAAERVIEHR